MAGTSLVLVVSLTIALKVVKQFVVVVQTLMMMSTQLTQNYIDEEPMSTWLTQSTHELSQKQSQ